MGRVNQKIALVTGGGAAPGIGSATAARLAEEGAYVYLSDINAETAEARAAEIRASGGQAKALRHDVTSEEAWDEVVAAIVDAHGRIDILVNNAGIAVTKAIEDLTPQHFARSIETNMTSVYLGTRRVVSEMRKSGNGGAIVNVSSIAALVGFAQASAYGASKAAAMLFTKSVAMETARDKIRINTVHPGLIWTTMQQAALRHSPEGHRAALAAIPMGTLGEPIDVANCVLFLASDEARYITGAALVVDGGMTVP